MIIASAAGRRWCRLAPVSPELKLDLRRNYARVAADPWRDRRCVDPETNLLRRIANSDMPDEPATRSIDPDRARGKLDHDCHQPWCAVGCGGYRGNGDLLFNAKRCQPRGRLSAGRLRLVVH